MRVCLKKHSRKFPQEYFGPIAHRGLHDEEATENGLKAFSRAIESGLPFECDVHLTKDGELLVSHDSDLERVTGRKGTIEELTSQEIRESYRLKDGGVVPTLKEVLALNEGKTLIVIEVKTYKRNHRKIARALNKELSLARNEKIVVISFDPRALILVKRHPRGLLIERNNFWIWAFKGFFESVDLEKVLLEKKCVQRYSRRHIVNVWTIENEEEAAKALEYANALTFQNIAPEKIRKIFLDK